MQISTRHNGSVTILALSGKFFDTDGLALRTAVLDALNSGATQLLLNLSAVTQTDADALNELLGAYTTVTNRGGRLKLCALTLKIEELLQTSSLVNVFDVFDSEAEAVESFM